MHRPTSACLGWSSDSEPRVIPGFQPDAAAGHGAAAFQQFVAGLHLVIEFLEGRLLGKPAPPQGRHTDPDPVALLAAVPALVHERAGDLLGRERPLAFPLQPGAVDLDAEFSFSRNRATVTFAASS